MKDFRKFIDLWNRMMFILTPSQKRWGIVVMLFSLIGSFVELLGVSVILPFAQAMIEPEKLRRNPYVGAICEAVDIRTNAQLVVALTIAVIFIYLLKNLFLAFLAWLRIKYATKVERELSLCMVKSYLNRGYLFLRNTNYSVISRGCLTSVASIQQIISCFFRIVTDSITLLFIFIFIAITDISMAIAMTLVAIIALIFVTTIFRKKVKEAGNTYFKYVSKTSQWLQQLFYGMKEILVMNKESYFTANYTNYYGKKQKACITQNLSQVYPTYFIETLCVTGLMFTVCIKVLSMDNPSSYIAQLAAFAVAAFRMLPSIGRISSTFNYFVFQIPSANEVYENMKEAKKVGIEHELKGDESVDRHFNDKICIEGLTYKYPDSKSYLFENLSLDIKKGESIALVGMSGAGKSTLADIILGLLKPEKGSVKMDGLDIRQNRATWANNVGFVPQDVYLMDDTIRRNIGFGYDDSEISDEKVWDALKQAQIKDFVKGLPDGLDTLIGERGVNFSGGQAQRLAIARALYNNPEVLVLDEATSALDNNTEHAIMDAINALRGQKTLIIIAHRLTTVKNCDHIYEVSNGRLMEKEYEDLL